jgi:hypothetical protein
VHDLSEAPPCVVSVADHTGWAHVVCVAIEDAVPVVIARRRLTLIDEGLPTMPYHHETVRMNVTEANTLLARVRQSIERCTTEVMTRLVTGLQPAHHVVALAIREPPFAELPESVAEVQQSYRLQNAADGVMYQRALCRAARALGLEIEECRRGEELARASTRAHVTPRVMEAFVTRTGRPAGPPWTEEHRRAFAAAIAVLADRVSAPLRIPRS